MDRHVTLLGALHVALGALLLCAAAVTFVAVSGGGLISGDPEAMRITLLIGTLVGAFLVLLALPGIVAGVGLLRRRPWARIVALVIGAIHLINIPFGTALGVYTFWVLLQDETERMFRRPEPARPAAAAT